MVLQFSVIRYKRSPYSLVATATVCWRWPRGPCPRGGS